MNLTESMSGANAKNPVLCPHCQKPVPLENCKIDEHGQAVHEKCYVRLLRKRMHARQPED